jgi:hypothetical protein
VEADQAIDGRGGIRTHGTLLTYTHFPGVRLKPLGHPSQHRLAALTIAIPQAKVASKAYRRPRLADNYELRTTRLRVAFAGLLNGQGEIRTLDTGFTGMPVFETGAFNHSATCPAASQLIRREKLLQPGQTCR